MLIGAHVSAAGGVEKSIKRAQDIGAECIQIFASSPRTWKFRPIPEKNASKFRAAASEASIGPTVLHASYLVAIASSDPALVERSVQSLINHLRASEQLGALGLIFHPASHKGRGFEAVFNQFVTNVQTVLEEAPGESLLMLETSAGSGDHIGSRFEELGKLIKAIDNPRVAVCLDTQHVWAAGYDIVEKDAFDATMDEFDRDIGFDLLRTVHANDSKRELGSSVDRHDNIGEGLIGETGFANVMSHPAFKGLPFYLEVPGFDKSGPDKPNVEALKRIRASVGA